MMRTMMILSRLIGLTRHIDGIALVDMTAHTVYRPWISSIRHSDAQGSPSEVI